jgi:hypothetical protein
MKTYEAPRLVAKGDVTDLTQGMFDGSTDPNGITNLKPTGSVGFGL